MFTHQWRNHTIEVRNYVSSKATRGFMVTVDGRDRHYMHIDTWVNTESTWKGEPGGWFPAPSVEFTLRDSDGTHDGRVEFEYWVLPHDVRYRAFVQDDQIGAGEFRVADEWFGG